MRVAYVVFQAGNYQSVKRQSILFFNGILISDDNLTFAHVFVSVT